jgi:hypothetical protein
MQLSGPPAIVLFQSYPRAGLPGLGPFCQVSGCAGRLSMHQVVMRSSSQGYSGRSVRSLVATSFSRTCPAASSGQRETSRANHDSETRPGHQADDKHCQPLRDLQKHPTRLQVITTLGRYQTNQPITSSPCGQWATTDQRSAGHVLPVGRHGQQQQAGLRVGTDSSCPCLGLCLGAGGRVCVSFLRRRDMDMDARQR